LTAAERRSSEFEILKALEKRGGEATVEELTEALALDHSAVARSILTLEQGNLVQASELRSSRFILTDEGRSYAEQGLPEKRLVEAVLSLGGVAPLDMSLRSAKIPKDTANIALGWAVRKGWCQVLKEKDQVTLKVKSQPTETPDEQLLRLVSEKAELGSEELTEEQLQTVRHLKGRKLLSEKPLTLRVVKITEAGLEQLRRGFEPEVEVTALTGDLLTSGKWREVKLREYDVTASPPAVHPGKKHYYLEFLEDVRRTFLSLGFEEAEGPYVEMELWNFDALFQPQDHPAREIHDIYVLKKPTAGMLKDEALARRIKQTHENGWVTGSTGWRYQWRPEVARRLILRSHTTAVSARYLSQHRKPPVKMFCISKVFRPDVLDITHAVEFFMCEGIAMDSGLTFRHLLGFLTQIAEALGLGETVFRPSYFPFTEPSVESFVKHPRIGWVEWVGAGMFRPEVAGPLGVKHPVAAWGIGIDRLAMAKLGIDDIRELHSTRLDFIRAR